MDYSEIKDLLVVQKQSRYFPRCDHAVWKSSACIQAALIPRTSWRANRLPL